MFGHDDHNHNQDQATPDVPVNEALLEPGNFEDASSAAAAVENATGAVEIAPSEPSGPGTDDNTATVVTPAASTDDSDNNTEASDEVTAPTVVEASDPLLSLKRDALQSLSPLLGHLDQTPEEKFRTTMMLIQATDNKDLITEAYAAAKAIPDEKVRAQALLDVVNEINYFTTQAK